MTYFERIEDHEERGLDKRSSAYFVPDVADLMLPILAQVQELEDVFWQIFDARFLDSATGEGLRLLGLLVGEPVAADGDEGLRLRIRLKVRALASNGTRPDLRALLALLPGTTWTITGAAGWVVLTQATGSALASEIFRILSFAVGDGVLLQLDTNRAAAAVFEFPSFDAEVSGSAWDSYDGAETGAPWLSTEV